MFLDLSLDSHVLGFTAGIAVLTGILFGVLPALRSTRVSLTAAMKGSHAAESWTSCEISRRQMDRRAASGAIARLAGGRRAVAAKLRQDRRRSISDLIEIMSCW